MLNDTGILQGTLNVKLPLRAMVVPNEYKEHLSKGLLGVQRGGILGGASTFGTIDFVTTDAHEIDHYTGDTSWII